MTLLTAVSGGVGVRDGAGDVRVEQRGLLLLGGHLDRIGEVEEEGVTVGARCAVEEWRTSRTILFWLNWTPQLSRITRAAPINSDLLGDVVPPDRGAASKLAGH